MELRNTTNATESSVNNPTGVVETIPTNGTNVSMFPKKYHNAIFSAQHGSWNAITPRGARIMVTYLDAEGNASLTEPFAEGWLTEMGVYLGRPVDVQQYIDGSLHLCSR